MPASGESAVSAGRGSRDALRFRAFRERASSPGGGRAGYGWRALAFVVGLAPFATLSWLGAALGFIAGSVLRIRRAHVEEAMRRAEISAPRANAARMYRSLGASLLELLWLAAHPASPAKAFARFDAASEATLKRALAKGRGVVLAASHTGNWELAAAAIAESFALTAVTKRIHSASIDAFVVDARAARGWTAASGAGVLDVARDALRRGGIAAMMIDQVPDRSRHALRIDFLGAPASADRAPATLAMRMGAPLVVVASSRDAHGEQAMRVLAVIEPTNASHQGRQAWITDATRDASRALDTFVCTHPSEWLWMHRRWRSPP